MPSSTVPTFYPEVQFLLGVEEMVPLNISNRDEMNPFQLRTRLLALAALFVITNLSAFPPLLSSLSVTWGTVTPEPLLPRSSSRSEDGVEVGFCDGQYLLLVHV